LLGLLPRRGRAVLWGIRIPKGRGRGASSSHRNLVLSLLSGVLTGRALQYVAWGESVVLPLLGVVYRRTACLSACTPTYPPFARLCRRSFSLVARTRAGAL
jgi:hypothetical protein